MKLKIFPPFLLFFLIFMNYTSLQASKNIKYCSETTEEIFQLQEKTNAYRTEVFTVKKGSKVNVTSPSGNIIIKGVPGDTVRVELYVRRGLNILSSDRSLDEFRIQLIQRGNDIFASVEFKRSGAWSSILPQFNFIIYAPENTSGIVNTTSGNIEIANLAGDHRIRSTGGNVHIENLSGTTWAYTSGGNVNVIRHDGELRVKTLGGSIQMDHISGTILANSMGGGISLLVNKIDLGIDLHAVGGSIKANIPGLLGLDMDVHGQMVELNRIQNFVGEIKRNSIVGKLNGGGLPVKIRSQGGKIELEINQERL